MKKNNKELEKKKIETDDNKNIENIGEIIENIDNYVVETNNVIEDSDEKKQIDNDRNYQYEELSNSNIWGNLSIDTSKREQYLSDSEFKKVFKMSKQEFSCLHQWKQIKLKKDTRLF